LNEKFHFDFFKIPQDSLISIFTLLTSSLPNFCHTLILLGVHNQERGGLPVRTLCGQRVFFRLGSPYFLAQNTVNFFEIYGESAWTFCVFVRTSFIDGSLLKNYQFVWF